MRSEPPLHTCLFILLNNYIKNFLIFQIMALRSANRTSLPNVLSSFAIWRHRNLTSVSRNG